MSCTRDKWLCLLSLPTILLEFGSFFFIFLRPILVTKYMYVCIYIIWLEHYTTLSISNISRVDTYIATMSYIHINPLINLYFNFLSSDSKGSFKRGLPKRFKAGYRYFQAVFPGSVTSIHEVRYETRCLIVVFVVIFIFIFCVNIKTTVF